VETIEWIENWFLNNCDGDWEHTWGIEITTLDNPGWQVKIDLQNTNLEDLSIEYRLIEVSEIDWYGYKIEDGVFIAAGDPNKLKLILEKFREIATNKK